MLRIDHISLPPGAPEGELRRQAAKVLGVPPGRSSPSASSAGP